MCRDDKRALKTAIENYRLDLGGAPTSEFDLIAHAYLRERSELYDVRIDGSVVAQGLTCAAVADREVPAAGALLPTCEPIVR